MSRSSGLTSSQGSCKTLAIDIKMFHSSSIGYLALCILAQHPLLPTWLAKLFYVSVATGAT
eukprot:1139044-Pelagomonas_calceolata.AAC.13